MMMIIINYRKRNAEEEAEYRSFVSASVENLKQSEFENALSNLLIKGTLNSKFKKEL